MITYILYGVGALLIFFGLTLFSIGNIFMSFASFVLGFLAVNQGVKIKNTAEIERTESFIDPETGELYVREDKKLDRKKNKKDDRKENQERE